MNEQPSATRPLFPRGKRFDGTLPATLRGATAFNIYPYAKFGDGTSFMDVILKLDDSHIIVKGHDNGTGFGMYGIFNVADPAAPVLTSTPVLVDQQGIPCVHGDYLLAVNSGSPDTLLIIDCSDRSNMQIVGEINHDMFQNAAHVKVRADGLGVVVGNNGFGVFDASALPAITFITFISDAVEPRYESGAYAAFFDNSVVQNRLLVSTFNPSVLAINMTNPASPVIYAQQTNNAIIGGCEFIMVRADGEFAYVVLDLGFSSASHAIVRLTLTSPSSMLTSSITNPIYIDSLWHMAIDQQDGAEYLYVNSRVIQWGWTSRWLIPASGIPQFDTAVASGRLGSIDLCAMGDGLLFTSGAAPVGTPFADNGSYFTGIQFL